MPLTPSSKRAIGSDPHCFSCPHPTASFCSMPMGPAGLVADVMLGEINDVEMDLCGGHILSGEVARYHGEGHRVTVT